MENAESAGEMVLTISVTRNECTRVVAKDDAITPILSDSNRCLKYCRKDGLIFQQE